MRHVIAIAVCVLSGLACTAENEAPDTVSSGADRASPDASYTGGRPTVGGGVTRPRDGGSGSSTTVPDGTPLSALDEPELAALCGDVRETFEDAISIAELDALSCTFRALSEIDLDRTASVVTVNLAQCKANVADCLGLSSGSNRLHCETESFRTVSADCDATAEQYRACMAAGATAFASAVDAVTCESLAEPNTAPLAFKAAVGIDPFALPACAALATSCPRLFGSASRGEPAADGCDETCRDSDDGYCDDGGDDSQSSICPLGTDCLDCGLR